MGEEVKMSDYETNGDEDEFGEEDRVAEWEMGLPNADDIAPLSQPLIPPELASAFSISPEPTRTLVDVNRALQTTLTSLRGGSGHSNNKDADTSVVEATENESARKPRKPESEEADSALDDPSARAQKRPRLVWTPQLHKRFVDVVGYLGIKNAVPKTIMQMMNVEGLTRENVASHLQKYRLYLKRMQGLSPDGPSSSEQHESASANGAAAPMPAVPYHSMMPMPVYGHVGMPMGNGHQHHQFHHGFDGNVGYNMLQQRDWSGSNYGSVMSYPHHHHPHQVAPNDNM
ncbi:hypothetical protein K2173_015686 [Erythroxylum novogranatense]|uniref:Myb-like domain-containing protein n=1 Tax=Erythroxylum novogranatense TaxID=1862640 RepID=A0AAV8SE53_9ROSI|nr:hypothetical protein K2173_015686 [Erythroxylum novogranatense]